MMRLNKLEGLSLEMLSSQVLEVEGQARTNPIGVPFRCFLLVLPANVRLDWKVIARYKHSSLLGLVIIDEGKKFYNVGTRWSGGRRPQATPSESRLRLVPTFLASITQFI